MIAIVVFVLFLIAFAWLSMSGSAPDVSIWPILGLFLLFAGCFAAGVYIAAILGVLGVVTGFVFSDRPFYNFLGSIAWTTSSNYVLIALPLFLLTFSRALHLTQLETNGLGVVVFASIAVGVPLATLLPR